MMSFSRYLLKLVLCFSVLLSFSVTAQEVGQGISAIHVNDWGSGHIATFEYTITGTDVVDDKVRDWRFDIEYTGPGTLQSAYMSGYAGSIRSGHIEPDGGYAITNEGVGFRPELNEGQALTFNLQVQGSGFNADDYSITFVNLTRLPTNTFQSSLVNVNDWFNPSWGGGFNATFRCDVLGPDAQIGPVTDLLIDFNYTGAGAPSSAWTQSHNGPIEYGFISPDGGYAIRNRDGFQPELYAGDSITFAIQVQGAGFSESDFDISCSSPNADPAPVNQKPQAEAQSLTAVSGQSLALTLAGSDADGDAMNFNVVSLPANGVLSGSAPQLTYVSSPQFSGVDEFTYTVNDGTIDTDRADSGNRYPCRFLPQLTDCCHCFWP